MLKTSHCILGGVSKHKRTQKSSILKHRQQFYRYSSCIDILLCFDNKINKNKSMIKNSF